MNKLRCPFEGRYFGAFVAGCSIASLCANNIMYIDYHPGNIIIRDNGDVAIMDLDDVEFVDFPRELQQYARSIMNFHINFDKELGAAFRFGFIHSLGEAGAALYDYLFNEFDLSCYPNKQQNVALELDGESLTRKYEQWINLIRDTFIYQVSEQGMRYDEYYYLSLQQKNLELFRKSKEKYKDNMEVLRYEYETYLANSLRSGNRFDYLSALVTLSYAEWMQGNEILSAYYYSMANLEMQEEDEQFSGQLQIRRHVAALFMKKYGAEECRNLFLNITMETVYLRSCNPMANCYFEIWYWADFQKQHCIEELMGERNYLLYSCPNCGFEGFAEWHSAACSCCNCKDIKEISITEKIRLMVEAEQKKQEQSVIEVPKLDCVEALDTWFDIIKERMVSGELDATIALAKEVESYLADHPEIKDAQGYVKMPKHCAGNVYRDIHDPTKLTKLLSIDCDYMKRDCETEIYVVLYRLYLAQDQLEGAETYAQRVIWLLNHSDRQIPSDYAKEAYGVLSELAERKGDNQLALEYASYRFVIHAVLELEQSDVDLISSVNQIGKKYAISGHYGIAQFCFYSALRRHINKHGVQHPESIPIYINLGDVHAEKGKHAEACEFYGFAWMILEATRNEQYNRQKTMLAEEIEKCLKKMHYPGTLDEWKEEWIKPEKLQPFPEEHFVEHKKKIEISSWDDYVVYGI